MQQNNPNGSNKEYNITPEGRSGIALTIFIIVILLLIIYGIYRHIHNAHTAANNASMQTTSTQTSDQTVSTTGQTSTSSNSTPILDLASVVNNSNPQSLINQQVNFSNVTVKSIGTNDMIFWLNSDGATNPGATQGEDLLVYMNPQLQSQVDTSNNNGALKDGQRVTVSGTLMMVPSLSDMESQWNLNNNDAQYVQNKQIYLSATNVQINQ